MPVSLALTRSLAPVEINESDFAENFKTEFFKISPGDFLKGESMLLARHCGILTQNTLEYRFGRLKNHGVFGARRWR